MFIFVYFGCQSGFQNLVQNLHKKSLWFSEQWNDSASTETTRRNNNIFFSERITRSSADRTHEITSNETLNRPNFAPAVIHKVCHLHSADHHDENKLILKRWNPVLCSEVLFAKQGDCMCNFRLIAVGFWLGSLHKGGLPFRWTPSAGRPVRAREGGQWTL